MSKKKKELETQRRILEKKKLRSALCIGIVIGLFVGLINGCIIGYTLKKRFSNDGKKRIEERAFYKARLGEIKHSLYQIKARIAGDAQSLDAIELDDVVAKVSSEIDNV